MSAFEKARTNENAGVISGVGKGIIGTRAFLHALHIPVKQWLQELSLEYRSSAIEDWGCSARNPQALQRCSRRSRLDSLPTVHKSRHFE